MSQILVIARVRDLGSRLHTPSQFFFAYPSRGGGGEGGKSGSTAKVMSCLKGHCH